MAVLVYDYEDYRRFLDKWLSDKKARSVRALAGRIGCSASYVTMVRKGDRSLKVEHARQWGEGLLLDDHEVDYWEALVRSESEPHEEDRKRAAREVKAVRAWRQAVEQATVLKVWSNWHVMAIIQFARCEGFQLEAEWIAERLMPPVSVEEAQEAIDVLVELGIVEDKDGKVVVHQMTGSMGRGVNSAALGNVRIRNERSWLKASREALQIPASERFVAALSVVYDCDRLAEITELLDRFEVVAAEASKDHVPNRVFQIGVAILPTAGRSDRDLSGENDS